MKKITVYSNREDKIGTSISDQDFIESVRTGKILGRDYKREIIEFRKSKTACHADLVDMPQFSVPAAFTDESISGITKWHSRIGFRFHVHNNPVLKTLSDVKFVKNRMRKDKYIKMAFKEIGDGLVVIMDVKEPLGLYYQAMEAANLYLAENYGLTNYYYDTDFLFEKYFFSYDPDPVYRKRSAIFDFTVSNEIYTITELYQREFEIKTGEKRFEVEADLEF
jgi:hypothetical protein